MFLHIGENFSVCLKDVIGIFDLERTTTTGGTRGFLKCAEDKGCIVSISDDMPKTFVVTKKNGKVIIYLTPISAGTLNKRV